MSLAFDVVVENTAQCPLPHCIPIDAQFVQLLSALSACLLYFFFFYLKLGMRVRDCRYAHLLNG